MKVGILAAIGFALLIGFPVVAGLAPDTDGDGTPDALDNCLALNTTQVCDTDGDGYGNPCDGDFNNDFTQNATDFGKRFSPDLMSGMDGLPVVNDGTDMNCDGTVNSTDFGKRFVPELQGSMTPIVTPPAIPGPSGLGCAGMLGCM